MEHRQTQEPEPAEVSATQFRDVIGCFASGVTVVTTLSQGIRHGATASAVSSLSLDPPMVLVCLNKQSSTAKAIAESRRFVVNILAEDQPDIALRFASRGVDKFEGLELQDSPCGAPVIEGALARIDCRLVEEVAGGTHWVFLAAVEAATRNAGAPLAYFRGRLSRLEMEQDEFAYKEIRQRLLQRALPTGRPLDLSQLAETLGVPRSAVYHSLSRCEHEGLVERADGPAFVLPSVTLQALRDALTALFGIWLGAIQLTIGRFSNAQLRELWQLVDRLKPQEAHAATWSAHAFLKARADVVNYFLTATGSTTMVDAFARADIRTMVEYCWSGVGALSEAEYEKIYYGFVDTMRAVESGDEHAATHSIRRLHAGTDAAFQVSFERHCARFAAHAGPLARVTH